MEIEVFKKTGEKIGTNSYTNSTCYDWCLKTAKSFEFIPEEGLRDDYVLGKFLLEDSEFKESVDEKQSRKFIVSRYKLLCKNKDPKKQFDDDANSKWKEFVG